MRSFAWLRRRRRTIASASIVTVSAVAIATLAMVYEGNPTTEVDLHDGGVWITKQSSLMVGHFNHESRVLDGGFRAASDDYDVAQNGSTVLVTDEQSVTSVDPAMVVLADSADIPAGAKAVLGGPTLAVLDPSSGSAWVLPSAGVSGFTVEGTEPTIELGEGADITVGQDGTVYAVSPESREIVTVPIDDTGEPGDPQRRGLDGIEDDAELTVTAVGTTAAVLDERTGTVYTSGGTRTEVPRGDTAVLQQPSPAATSVTLATASQLTLTDPIVKPSLRMSGEGTSTGAVSPNTMVAMACMTSSTPNDVSSSVDVGAPRNGRKATCAIRSESPTTTMAITISDSQ